MQCAMQPGNVGITLKFGACIKSVALWAEHETKLLKFYQQINTASHKAYLAELLQLQRIATSLAQFVDEIKTLTGLHIRFLFQRYCIPSKLRRCQEYLHETLVDLLASNLCQRTISSLEVALRIFQCFAQTTYPTCAKAAITLIDAA